MNNIFQNLKYNMIHDETINNYSNDFDDVLKVLVKSTENFNDLFCT